MQTRNTKQKNKNKVTLLKISKETDSCINKKTYRCIDSKTTTKRGSGFTFTIKEHAELSTGNSYDKIGYKSEKKKSFYNYLLQY